MRIATWIASAASDVRYAARALVRAPVYSTMAVLTLGLGIGASTAAYSVVESILLKPLPYAHPEQLVSVWSAARDFESGLVSYPDFKDYRAQSNALAGMAFITGDQMTLREREGGTGILTGMVTE